MATTIVSEVFEQARRRPRDPAHYVKRGGRWIPTSWEAYAAEIRRAARALISCGVAQGGTVAILGFNRPEWVILDVAAMAVGAAPAGIYTTSSADEIQFLAHHAASRVILVETREQWERIASVRDRLPELAHVVTMRGADDIDDAMVLSWDEFLDRAEQTPEEELDRRTDALEPDGLATLIYTSGTTGPPKGVMLSHRNLRWTAERAADIFGLDEYDSGLSYLPLSHVAEQMLTIHVPAMTGGTIYFAESIAKVADNLREVQPTFVFGVPRIWEKLHAGVAAKLSEATGLRKALVDFSRWATTRLNRSRLRGDDPGVIDDLAYRLARKLVLSKLKQAIGMRDARVCVSGAAPIAREVLEFFAALDIIICEIYGQSEDCGPTSSNLPGRIRIGSVGHPLPGVNVQIADDDEVLVKGPNVFLGYYKDEEATRETLVDGWLHSGDLGRFDEDGFLHITGRKKDLIITAGGKNIAPKNIETALKNTDVVGEAVVIGDRRKYLTALIALDDEAAAPYIDGHPGPAAQNPHIRERIQAAVDATNQTLARVEQIKRFTILPRALTIADGELTPTLKVKRKAVAAHFADEIEAMYED